MTASLLLLCALLCGALPLRPALPDRAAVSLTVEVRDIRVHQGRIQVGIYADPAAFPAAGREYRIERAQVTGAAARCTVQGLPPGTYAVALFHDVNSDGVCNLSRLGIPLEPYGFANNVRPVFSAPGFADAQVLLRQDTQISVTLRH